MCRCSGKSFILRSSPGRWYLRRSHCNVYVLFVAKTAGIRTFVITNKLTPAHGVRESKATEKPKKIYPAPIFFTFIFIITRETHVITSVAKKHSFISLVSPPHLFGFRGDPNNLAPTPICCKNDTPKKYALCESTTILWRYERVFYDTWPSIFRKIDRSLRWTIFYARWYT